MDKKLERKRTKEARIWMIINDICKGFNNLSLTRKYKDDWKISQTTMTNLITESYERMKIGDEDYLNELRQIKYKTLEEIANTALRTRRYQVLIKRQLALKQKLGISIQLKLGRKPPL